MIHALKVKPEFFEASATGAKNFEVRKNDRPYKVGDYVALNEYDGANNHDNPDNPGNEGYTGRCLLRRITYILSDADYCKEGCVVLGLEPCTADVLNPF